MLHVTAEEQFGTILTNVWMVLKKVLFGRQFIGWDDLKKMHIHQNLCKKSDMRLV